MEWTQLPDETAQQYKAFCCFLNAEKRSIDAAYREYTKRQKQRKATKGHITRPSSAFRKWAKQFNWPDRAKAYDIAQQRKHEELTEEQHRKFTLALHETAEEALQQAKERLATSNLKELTGFLQFTTSLTGTQVHAELAGLRKLKEGMSKEEL